jgi:hypothetical protein
MYICTPIWAIKTQKFVDKTVSEPTLKKNNGTSSN